MRWSETFRNLGFGDLPEAAREYAAAAAVVLPVPFERTTSWGTGTYLGPHAVMLASRQLEMYDEELGFEPATAGIATLPPPRSTAGDVRDELDAIRAAAAGPLGDGKLLVSIGGEHTVTLPLVEAALGAHPELGVLHFDAHADLRDVYEGTTLSHACVMRRVRELGVATASWGVRSLSRDEAELIAAAEVPVVWGHQIGRQGAFDELLEVLPERIYVTFDVDYLDPGLLPATGTPEPGGGDWPSTLALLRRAFSRRRVVGIDFVELSPSPGQHASDFTVAKLVYKAIGYHAAAARDR